MKGRERSERERELGRETSLLDKGKGTSNLRSGERKTLSKERR